MQVTQVSRYLKSENKPNSTEVESDTDYKQFLRPMLSNKSEGSEAQVKAVKEITSTLTRFKLSRNEIKVYLYLTRYGAQRAQKIAESLAVHRTEVYKILRTLESEGIVCKILEKPLKFAGVSFEKIIEREIEERRQRIHHLEKKKKELVKLWNQIPKSNEIEEEKERVQVLEGRKQISARVTELLEQSKKQINAVLSDQKLVWLYNSPFFENIGVHPNSGFEVKILTEYSETSTYLIEQVELINVDFAFVKSFDQPSFIIGDDGSMLLFMEDPDDKMCVMETNYRFMLKSYDKLFEMLWKDQKRR